MQMADGQLRAVSELRMQRRVACGVAFIAVVCAFLLTGTVSFMLLLRTNLSGYHTRSMDAQLQSLRVARRGPFKKKRVTAGT